MQRQDLLDLLDRRRMHRVLLGHPARSGALPAPTGVRRPAPERLIATAAFPELVTPFPEPALDTLPLPGRRAVHTLLQLADPLAQPAATLPIALRRNDVGDCRTALRGNRPRLRGNRDRDRGAEQQGDKNAGSQHGRPRVGCESHDNGRDGVDHPWSRAPSPDAYSQNAITIVLSSPSTRLMRFGLCTMPATPCVGAIVRKPRGRSSSRTVLAAPAWPFPFST